jgi:hypothetical protein
VLVESPQRQDKEEHGIDTAVGVCRRATGDVSFSHDREKILGSHVSIWLTIAMGSFSFFIFVFRNWTRRLLLSDF